nr:ribonuclease H-like domain-containing protein [Tanacetum cinerariifolium]
MRQVYFERNSNGWEGLCFASLVKQIYEPTFIKEKLDRKNEIKAREILLMAHPNKDQLKFHSYQDAKLLMEAIEKRCGGNKESKKVQRTLLKQQYENFTASSSKTLDQTFDSTNSTSSTNEADNTAYGVSTAHTQGNTVNSIYVDNLSDVVICAFLASLQSVEERLVCYKKNEAVFEEKNNILNLEVRLRDNALVEYTKKLEKVEKERYELKLTVEKYQNSPKSLYTLLESQVNDKVKTGLGYKAASPAVENFVNSSKMIENQENVKSRLDKGYHAVPLPYTGNYIPPKPDLMFIDEQVKSESVDVVSNVSSNAVKTVKLKVKYVNVKIKGNPRQKEYKEKGIIDSGCSRHMTGNKCYLTDYEDYDGGFVSFGYGKGRISRKGKIKTGTSDFNDVYFCKELKYNLFKNQLDYKVKVIKCDNGSEFKNSVMNHFYDMKWIKREFSISRTPQQNSVAKRKNKTLIEAARTMLVDSKLPTTFWAEAVNTACYVLNRALVIKPHNKTPYELIRGRPPLIDFMKPFGIVEETLNIRFHENTTNVKGNGPDWLFDINSLTISMNYVPVVAGFQTNGIAGTKDNIVVGQAEKKKEPE